MEKNIFNWALFLVVCVVGASILGSDAHFLQEEPAARKVLRLIGQRPQLLKPLADLVPESARAELPPDLYLPVGEGTEALCTGCKTTLSLLRVISGLLAYETYEWAVIDICRVAFGFFSPVSTEVCPGLIGNYGPHVAFIVREMSLKPVDACDRLNYCIPDDVKPQEAADLQQEPSIEDSGRSGQEAWAKRAGSVLDILYDSAREGVRDKRHATSRVSHQKKLDDAIKVAHVTDFHVDKKYFEGGMGECALPVCCREDSPGNSDTKAGKWGYRANCNIPPRTIELFLRFVVDQNPDFVIYSGDNPPHSAWEETPETQLGVSRWAAETLTRIIFNDTGVLTYPTIGNHDTHPTNLYSMIEDIHNGTMTNFNKVWGESWATAADFNEEQLETIRKAGYYTMKVRGYDDLRIVAFNSNYGYTDNYYNILNFDRPEYLEMMEWIHSALTEARNQKEKVIMMSHHDIGKFENIIEFDHNITKLLAEFSDIIIFHPVGHTHRDEFRLYFGDDKKKPAGVLLVGQTMNSWPYVNPGFRIFYLDKKTYHVLDYDQYFIDLDNALNMTEEPVPTLLYRLTEAYNMDDATPESYMKLAERMAEDPTLVEKYYAYQRYVDKPDTCDDKCKISELCQAISQAYDIYLQCVKDKTPIQTTVDPAAFEEITSVAGTETSTPIQTTVDPAATEEITSVAGTETSSSGSLLPPCLALVVLAWGTVWTQR